jgi:ABC-type nitrate/sulfonate/bicarbonate transport system substrate-binding protein
MEDRFPRAAGARQHAPRAAEARQRPRRSMGRAWTRPAAWGRVVGLLLLASCGAPAAGGAPTSVPPTAPAAASAPRATTAPQPAPTAPRALEPARFIVTAISLSISPAPVAYDMGFFAEEGIDADLVYVAGAATPAQALVAGEVQFVGGAGATAVPAGLEGAGLVVIAVHVNTFAFSIMAPALERMDQLRDKRVAITRRGAATDYAARYALPRFGLQPERDVLIVPLEGNPEILAGLETGAADAGVMSDFGTAETRRRGYHELLDISTLGVEYSLTGLVTTRKLVEERPDYVRRFVRGWVRGLAYTLTNPQDAMPLLMKFMRSSDLALTEAGYREYAPIVQRVPYPRAAGIQTVLDTLAATNPRAASASPQDFYDDRFIRELDNAGVFRQLYGE